MQSFFIHDHDELRLQLSSPPILRALPDDTRRSTNLTHRSSLTALDGKDFK